MEEYQKRVVTEKEELDGKILLLDQFIGSEKFSELGRLEAKLMAKQIDTMELYSSILEARISLFDK